MAGLTYENLSKILRYQRCASSEQAVRLDDAFQNDLDHWMGGGTCFAITWHLYQQLQALGYQPRLLMGHKRRESNIHCALSLTLENRTWFFDPGYLIFDPLLLPDSPEGTANCDYALVPNWVRLRRRGPTLELWTGSVGQAPKLRFNFDLVGVNTTAFFAFWKASFSFEMMQYPVLNRLDREKGIQYYFQKGNLITRTAQGSTIEKIAFSGRTERLADIFKLDPQLIDAAFATLEL